MPRWVAEDLIFAHSIGPMMREIADSDMSCWEQLQAATDVVRRTRKIVIEQVHEPGPHMPLC